MQTTLNAAIDRYLRTQPRSRGTRNEYHSTVRKWEQWGLGGSIEELLRKDIRDFLDWVYERAVEDQGTNPGRTANKAREHLRAVFSWPWEQELIDSPPRFPKPRPQRDVAGRHYLTKAELNALYFATYQMRRPRGWDHPEPVGRYWRAALVLFFNYGLDTGTVWKSIPWHEPIRWRNVFWDRHAPDREVKEECRWGWLFYRRVKTGKAFHRPMNRAVHAHLKSIIPDKPRADEPVFLGGGARPNARFQALCSLAGIRPKTDVESGWEELWELKDLRTTCATYLDLSKSLRHLAFDFTPWLCQPGEVVTATLLGSRFKAVGTIGHAMSCDGAEQDQV